MKTFVKKLSIILLQKLLLIDITNSLVAPMSMVIIQYLLISGWIFGILMVFMINQLLITKFNIVQTFMVAIAEIYIHIVIVMNKKSKM